MTLKARRVLFVFCAVLFFTIAPIIILHTAGFRYSADAKKIIQTGIIYVTAKPFEGIKIFLDGREVKENLISRGVINKKYILNNLIPKSYDIKIAKEGFWAWEKKLAVSGGLITYAEPLLLPLNPTSILLLADYIENWSVSPDSTKIFYLLYRNKTAYIVIQDSVSGKTREKSLEQVADFMEGAKIVWSPDSKNFALLFPQNPRRFIVFGSVENDLLTSVALNKDITYSLWSDAGDLFIYLAANELYALDPKNPEAPRKIAKNAAGFGLLNDTVYYLDSSNLFVYKVSLYNPDNKEQASFAPITANATDKAKIEISEQGRIAIIAGKEKAEKLFILDERGIPVYLNSGVKTAKFSQDGQDLLYNSESEVFTYSLKGGAQQLITRLSQTIKNVSWYKDYNHIWFLEGNLLKNMELDPRSSRNVYNFLRFDSEPKQIIYDNISSTIYYDQMQDGKLSIYRVKAE